jgi:arginase
MTERKDNSFILTPYFLDELDTGLLPLQKSDWELIQVELEAENQQDRMVEIYNLLSERTAEVIKAGRRPVSVAGDCCSTIGFLAGLQHAGMDPILIWFDAHGDFNTWETTPSGFLGGMPLAMLVGLGEQRMVSSVGTTNLLEEQVFLTDGRDLDPGEIVNLKRSAVRHIPDVALLLEQPLPPGPIWVHFDVDVLNLQDLPAVSYPAQGGPSADLMRRVFKRLADSGQVEAVSLSSWNPELDTDGLSRDLSLELLSVLVEP